MEKIIKNILLIGGSGFIGENIVNYVLNNVAHIEYRLIILSRHFHNRTHPSCTYIFGDYSDSNLLTSLFVKWKFEKVFHCATSTTPTTSVNNILSDIHGNLIATIGLLEVMKINNCNYILYLSSGGAVYGEKHLDRISENEKCEPLSSYGVVKLTIENYLRLYQKQFGINYLIVRVSNPFGKFHVSEKQGVINIAIRRSLRQEQLEVWGDGTQSKDYIFVEDLVEIVFKLMAKEVINKTINVGSGETHSLNMILEIIEVYLPNLKINYIASKSTDVKDFCLDISLLKSIVSFQFTNFEEAIRKTILWEKSKMQHKL